MTQTALNAEKAVELQRLFDALTPDNQESALCALRALVFAQDTVAQSPKESA